MNRSLVDKLVQAVLYEGYILYPYRPSVKNHQRWTFGGLFPQAWADSYSTGDNSSMQAECILLDGVDSKLGVEVRFLHLVDRQVAELADPIRAWPASGEPSMRAVSSLAVDDKTHRPWQEAMERVVAPPTATIERLLDCPARHEFSFSANRIVEPIANLGGLIVGAFVREQRQVTVAVDLSAARLDDRVVRISARVSNVTPIDDSPSLNRDAALVQSLVSTNIVLDAVGGKFASMTDPPAIAEKHVAACKNSGAWPVLVGEPGVDSTMLAAPIILYDYPKIAPESPGDLFDGTEIDEILTLRVLTLTEDEKRDVASVDSRAREMLQRTESLAREQLMSLHGTMRTIEPFPQGDIFPAWDLSADRPKLPSIRAGGKDLHPGDRVRLRPRGGADAFDLVLNGKIATIAAIEQDYEDRIHLAVTVEDDPGADLGAAGKPGHRFFFKLEEIELLS